MYSKLKATSVLSIRTSIIEVISPLQDVICNCIRTIGSRVNEYWLLIVNIPCVVLLVLRYVVSACMYAVQWISFTLELPYKLVGVILFRLLQNALLQVNDILVRRIPVILCWMYSFLHLRMSRTGLFLGDFTCLICVNLCNNSSICFTLLAYLVQIIGNSVEVLFEHTKVAYAVFPSLLVPGLPSVVHIIAAVQYAITENVNHGEFSENFCHYSVNRSYTPVELINIMAPIVANKISVMNSIFFVTSSFFSLLRNIVQTIFRVDFLKLRVEEAFAVLTKATNTTFALPLTYLVPDGVWPAYLESIVSRVIQHFITFLPDLYPNVTLTVWVNVICRDLQDIYFIFHPWPRIVI